MNRPDFFIVGAQKCGTTALYACLRQHPDVFMPALKEPQFFAPDILGERRQILTQSEYLNCFADAQGQRRIGEASTVYLGSEYAPAAIKAFNPAARIIVMLRNPIDMMYLLYRARVYSGSEPMKSFAAALDADDAVHRSTGARRGPGLLYREAAGYASGVRRYFDVFGPENVHVIIYEDFRTDPSQVYVAALRFMEVALDGRAAFPIVNADKRARSSFVQKFLRQPPQRVRGFGRAVLPRPIRQLLWHSILRLNVVGKVPPMDSDLRSRLQTEFVRPTEELGRLIGRDLTSWGEAALPTPR